MKERPILFSGPMVNAIQSGQKTMTRRVIKDDWFRCLDPDNADDMPNIVAQCPHGKTGDRLWVRETFYVDVPDALPEARDCTYYRADGECCEQIPECQCAEVGKPKWRPSIFMPHWACRITLEITEVRIERLQSLSGADVLSEGADLSPLWEQGGMSYEEANAVWPTIVPQSEDESLDQSYDAHLRACFKRLWDKLNAKRGYGWDINPYVWVVSFRKIDQ